MTEYMKEYLTFIPRSRGLIIVAKWDEYSEKFLSNYHHIIKACDYRVVEKDGKEFLVFKGSGSDRMRGKKTNHLILDSRLDDQIVNTYILPCLMGVTRTVEIF